MRELVRRDFLKASGAGLGAALAARAVPGRRRAADPPGDRPVAPRRAPARRARLYEVLGDLPDRRRPISATKRGEEEKDGYVLESWVLDLNGLEPVPAYLARPKGPGHPAPAVVFDHSHGGGYDIGKKEFVEGRVVPAAGALREGAHRRGLRRPVHRPLVLRRAEPRDGARHLQGDALAGPGALGNDGLRLDPRPRLAADARRRGRRADRDPRHVDGQLDGAVAGRPRRAGEGHGGHLLPHRVPRAPRRQGPLPARHLLLRARAS